MKRGPEDLMSVIPEYRERHITYDLEDGFANPGEDDYLVSVRKDMKPGSIYQVVRSEVVNRKKPVPGITRYRLAIIAIPDMKDQVTQNVNNPYQIWVGRKWAFPIVWYSRSKKKPNVN